ncbi:MAG: hypothetical protein H9535_04165 [Ignavibacteria bacterium]|nr:hypothetical protein [Ignavibacteria bacterium]
MTYFFCSSLLCAASHLPVFSYLASSSHSSSTRPGAQPAPTAFARADVHDAFTLLINLAFKHHHTL